jgi:hypothetical protein
MRVEVDPGVQPFPKTVGELRKAAAWPENLAITIPQERDPNSAEKVSKVNVATRTTPKSQEATEGGTMRVMIKFTFPADTGNDAIRSGKVEKVFKQIAQELKPEAAYFFPQGGERGGLIVVDMTSSSQIVEIAERFFFGLNAKVEMVPVMALEDLQQGLSGIQGIVQRYG